MYWFQTLLHVNRTTGLRLEWIRSLSTFFKLVNININPAIYDMLNMLNFHNLLHLVHSDGSWHNMRFLVSRATGVCTPGISEQRILYIVTETLVDDEFKTQENIIKTEVKS